MSKETRTREQIREKNKKYYYANKKKEQARKRKYYFDNKETISAREKNKRANRRAFWNYNEKMSKTMKAWHKDPKNKERKAIGEKNRAEGLRKYFADPKNKKRIDEYLKKAHEANKHNHSKDKKWSGNLKNWTYKSTYKSII